MKLKYVIILLLSFALNTYAQNYTTGVSYSMGFGIGKTYDYINETSFTGFTVEGHKLIKPYFSVGIMTGWNIFSEKSNTTINLGSASISGEQARYWNIIPIMVNASLYYKNSNSRFTPFVRVHAGTYYIMQRFDIGVYTVNNDNWHFGLAPEVGFMINLSREMDILVNGKYNHAFDSGTRLSGDSNNKNTFFTINLGISYSRW